MFVFTNINITINLLLESARVNFIANLKHSKIEVMKIRMKMHSPGTANALRSFSLLLWSWQTFSPFQQNSFGLVFNIPQGYRGLSSSRTTTCLRQVQPKIENYGLPNVTYTYRHIHRNCPQRWTPHFQVDVDEFQRGTPILRMYVDKFQRWTPFLELYVEELQHCAGVKI